jgi:hypothetical protein
VPISADDALGGSTVVLTSAAAWFRATESKEMKMALLSMSMNNFFFGRFFFGFRSVHSDV